MVRKGTLALEMARKEADGAWYAKEWDINGRKALLAIRKA
jgi:hypothetical protein